MGVGGGTDAPKRLFTKGVRLSVSPGLYFFFFFSSDLLSLKSSRSKYSASTINYLLVVVFSTYFFPAQVIIPANRNRA